jgi:hypothetical protein
MLLLVLAVVHTTIFLGFGLGVGPFRYDPATLLVRGEPATALPGIEAAFPTVLGSFYCATGIGTFFAAVLGMSQVMQAASLPCLVYHFCAVHGHVFGDLQVVNPDKGHPSQMILAHGVLGILSMIAHFVAAVAAASSSSSSSRTKGTAARPQRQKLSAKKTQ